MKGIKTIAKGASIFFLGMLFSKVVGYFFRLLVSRIGVEEYGLFNLGLTIFDMVTLLASIGLLTGITRFVSHYHGKEDHKGVLRVMSTALKINIPMSFFLATVLFIFAEPISEIFFKAPQLASVLRFFSIAMPFYNSNQIMLAVTDAFQQIKYRVWIAQVFEPVIRVGLTALLFFFGFHLTSALFGFVIAAIFTSLFSLYYAIKVSQMKLKKLSKNVFSSSVDKPLLSYSWPLLLSKFVGVVYGSLDTIFIGILLSAQAVGVYNAALPTALLLLVVPSALASLYLPVITNKYAKGEDVFEEYQTVIRWLSFFLLPMTLFLMFFSSEIITALFGEAYIGAAPSLVILSFGLFFLGFTYASGNILAMLKKTKVMFLIYLFAMLLNLILNMVLIPQVGITGAAIGTTVSYFFSFCCLMFSAQFFLKRNPFTLKHIAFLFSGLLVFGSFLFVSRISSVTPYFSNIFSLLFIAGFGFLLYVLLLLLVKAIPEQDKAVFIDLIKQRMRHY